MMEDIIERIKVDDSDPAAPWVLLCYGCGRRTELGRGDVYFKAVATTDREVFASVACSHVCARRELDRFVSQSFYRKGESNESITG